MTKKHFVKFAEIIRAQASRENDLFAQQNAGMMAFALCDYFADVNPRFDRDRFLTACGLAKSQTACKSAKGKRC